MYNIESPIHPWDSSLVAIIIALSIPIEMEDSSTPARSPS